jgi:uncharacterized integral membrane protein
MSFLHVVSGVYLHDPSRSTNVTGRSCGTGPIVPALPPRSTLQGDVSSGRSDYEGLTGAPPAGLGDSPPSGAPAQRRSRGREIAAAVLGALVAVFALLNLGDVKVHWILVTGQTPLIVVIALAFLLGMVVDRLVIRARRKRRD